VISGKKKTWKKKKPRDSATTDWLKECRRKEAEERERANKEENNEKESD